MLKNISTYWICQIAGWSANIAISVFFVTTFGKPTQTYFISLIVTAFFGVMITHLMRLIIHKLKVLQKPLTNQIIYFLLLTLVFSIILGFCSETIDQVIGHNPERLKKYTRGEKMFLSSFSALWLILIWNLFYFIYHYVESNRRQQIDTLRLEALVKSLELKTIKSHINPHFIFNSLNSIRALVDENPNRARTAITELSNILRSSMKVDKMETVPLQQELNIVKDYLALEHMRFEERLKVAFNIEENTLNQSIPPMMIQTLVENAIKHGISKNIRGGEVQILSKVEKNKHEIVIRNSGKLNSVCAEAKEGFGLKSTEERLNLIYHGEATFYIGNADDGMVECKIVLPLN
ncbi:MAG: histidine kinase [Bacteroidetes bacterium]|nr:histidine kinase [Bacteroidota bacterium]